MHPALEVQSLNHWTAREVHRGPFLSWALVRTQVSLFPDAETSPRVGADS